jgi:hypothetical protein
MSGNFSTDDDNDLPWPYVPGTPVPPEGTIDGDVGADGGPQPGGAIPPGQSAISWLSQVAARNPLEPSQEPNTGAGAEAVTLGQGANNPIPAGPPLAQKVAINPQQVAEYARLQRNKQVSAGIIGTPTALLEVNGQVPLDRAAAIQEPPSRDPQPPWPAHGDQQTRYGRPALRRRFWSAIQTLANDPNPQRRIGPRLAEGLQVYFDGDGGALEAASNGAYAELTQSTLRDVLTRLRQSDPQLAEQILSRRSAGADMTAPYQLTPQQWALVLRNSLDVALGWAGGGGVQALETIGNAAPDQGSRELAAAIPSLLFSRGGAVSILNADINSVINSRNNAISSLPPDALARLPQGRMQRVPEHGEAFPRQNADAIATLARLGYANALRSAIVHSIPGNGDFMDSRREWLRRLQFLR